MTPVYQPRPQLVELLNRIGLFDGLPLDLLGRLAGSTHEIRVVRDETVFRKGESANTLHVVLSGQIRVYLPIADRLGKTLQTAACGDSIDVAQVWLGDPYPIEAIASKDSYLLKVERATLLREARQHGTLAVRLLDRVAAHEKALLHDMESCAPRSSLQRVACYLLQHRPNEETSAYELVLTTTKREIAHKLSLTQETLSRMLHQLKCMNLIDVEGRLIRVLDRERLLAVRLSDCAETLSISQEFSRTY